MDNWIDCPTCFHPKNSIDLDDPDGNPTDDVGNPICGECAADYFDIKEQEEKVNKRER